MPDPQDDVLYFKTPAAFKKWLAKNHDKSREQWVGFFKKATKRASITWPESVDEALCVGWIDGLRKSVDDERYKIRFTPRKPTSNWSRVNVDRMAVLEKEGRMTDAGRAAFARRSESRTGIYAYEDRAKMKLDPNRQATLERDKAAWAAFSARPPGYRANVIFWIMSAKREATRDKRLGVLIECSKAGEDVPPFRRRSKK